jgi:alpha-galactosidase
MAEISEIRWETPSLLIVLTIQEDRVVHLRGIYPTGTEPPADSTDSSLPLTEVRFAGEGTTDTKSSKTLVCAYASSRLKYQGHREQVNGQQRSLEITSYDDTAKFTVIATLIAYSGAPVVRSFATVRNDGPADIILSQVTSLVVGGLTGGTAEWYHDYVASSATNTWFREAQWHDHSLPSIGLDNVGVYKLPEKHRGSHASYSASNHGSFSTGGMLPMGMLRHRDGKDTWLWQVENNGSWRWELGDWKDQVYLAASGPVTYNHAWKECLKPTQSFTTVPCALVHIHDGIDAAFGALTTYRRAIRRSHPDNDTLPIIFNDFMNCLMGDPDEEKIKSLIQPVASAGAEYFVIDAGWYSDDKDWWDDVGAWEPSKKRFPSGFKHLLDQIRAAGLVPGVWLEPEVVGARSVVAKELPAEAFFQENGHRVVEKERYQLDYRHPAVQGRMNKIVDQLILEYGVGYFKFDYNVDVVQGTDVNAFSAGAGALNHNRAYLDWVRGILERHPTIIIENCSSGGQRLDYAMLALHPIQSTSDQQDPVLYAAVSVAIPTAVTPEQSASWAYPQPEWSDEINALTVVNSLMGRVHLSGMLHRLNESQLGLIRQGMDVYKRIRQDIKDSTPSWPWGLPGWDDEWLAVALQVPTHQYIAVWRRGGDVSRELPITQIEANAAVDVEVLYPVGFEVDAAWNSVKRVLEIKLPATTCARLLKVTVR